MTIIQIPKQAILPNYQRISAAYNFPVVMEFGAKSELSPTNQSPAANLKYLNSKSSETSVTASGQFH